MAYIDQDKVDAKTREKLEAIIQKSYSTFWMTKRLFDIFFAVLILLFFLPLMIIISIVIVIDDPRGGPFYKQIRVGRHGKEFYMYKFRTMRKDADKMIDELAKHSSLSRSSFIRKFNEICHTSPAKYINDVRISAAKQLLNNTSFSVSEIAGKTGFYDIAHFTKSFTLSVGISPVKYREGTAIANSSKK